jgi:biopolymer transport protein ExbD
MRLARSRSEREPTIALINIVFLMLIFFMVAGTLAQPIDKELKLVSTADLDGTPPPDALVLYPDGRMTHGGEDVASAEAYLEAMDEDARKNVRLVPDRDTPASTLVAIANALRGAGAERVVLVTEKGLQ